MSAKEAMEHKAINARVKIVFFIMIQYFLD